MNIIGQKGEWNMHVHDTVQYGFENFSSTILNFNFFKNTIHYRTKLI